MTTETVPRTADEAWDALYEELVPMAPAVLGWTGKTGAIIARHRPLIEAAIGRDDHASYEQGRLAGLRVSKPFRTAPMKDGIRYDSSGDPMTEEPSDLDHPAIERAAIHAVLDRLQEAVEALVFWDANAPCVEPTWRVGLDVVNRAAVLAAIEQVRP